MEWNEMMIYIETFLMENSFRGEWTYKKYGGSLVLTFTDGTKAKLNISMWKAGEVALDESPSTNDKEKYKILDVWIETPFAELGNRTGISVKDGNRRFWLERKLIKTYGQP